MDVTAVVIIALSVAAGSLLKGITGVGGPIIAIPVAAAFLGVERAVVVLAIPGVAMNAHLMWRYRDAGREAHDLPVLAVTGLIGVLLGTLALKSVDERLLAVFLAVAIGSYLAVRIVNPSFRFGPRARRLLSPAVGVSAGLMQGATGMSAPVVATYIHGLGLTRSAYVLAVSVVFQVFSVLQVIVIALLGLYDWGRLTESLLVTVPAVALLPAGDWIGRRLSPGRFDAVVLTSLAGIAGKLVYDAVTAA